MKNTRKEQTGERKPYQRPVIVYDARLEAQAGSPVGENPLIDVLDLPGE